MTLTLPALSALSESEAEALSQQLSQASGASLDYARGVFTAVASGPTPLDPTTWLPWLLGSEIPDKTTLRQMIDLLVRDAQSIAECLDLEHPWLPTSEPSLTQFCKGFIRATQHDDAWQKASELFVKLLPLAVQAGYLDMSSVQRFVPESTLDVASWLERERESLPERLSELHKHFAPARQLQRTKPISTEKVGRNEPCPCGSGKKHKKCCAH